jgi:DNA-binding NtrC family response regulator
MRAAGFLAPEIYAPHARSLIEEALRNSSGNQSEAARHLHVSRATLSYKMKAYALDIPRMLRVLTAPPCRDFVPPTDL